MRCRRLKQTETSEGYKQSQITDFFKNSTSSKRRKLFVESSICPKMPIQKRNDDSKNPVRDRSPLPYSLSSGDGNAAQTFMQLNKPSTLKVNHIETPKNSEDNIHSTQANISEKVIKSACSIPKIYTSTKMNKSFDTMVDCQSSKMENRSVLQNVLSTPKKSCSEAFTGRKLVCDNEVESPDKRLKVDFSPEEKLLTIQINLLGMPTFNTPPTNNKSSETSLIRSKDSTPTSQKKIASVIPKMTPTRTRNDSKMKPEMDEQLNVSDMELLKSLFEEILQEEKKELLTTQDIYAIEEFLKMDVNHQYFLIKLFLDQPLWYNMQEFCVSINLHPKLSQKEIGTMYEYHRNNVFIYTDLSQLSAEELLNMLSLKDLRQIVRHFFSKPHCGSKPNTIQYLKEKLSEDILKDYACKYLGYCIKLKENIRSSFNKAYVLQTYSNMSYCENIQSYLKDFGFIRVVLPNYTVESFTPFKTKEQFSRFYEAVMIKIEIRVASNIGNYVVIKRLCEDVFEKLKSIDDNGKWNKHWQEHLRNFSAEYQYITILNKGIEKLNMYPYDVEIWLKFLIENYPLNSAKGFWYKQLAHITLNNLKNYEKAARILIDAFEFDEREKIFDFLQIYELSILSDKIKTTRSYKVYKLYCDELHKHSAFEITNFQNKCITCGSVREGKKKFFYEDGNNECIYEKIESIALKSYLDDGNYEGVHCEEKLIIILFNLFFWDIMYEYYVPLTFISKLQNTPLDMYSEYFYKRRKSEIDLRLEAIASEWSERKMVEFLKENWNYHSHEKSVADFDGLGKNLEEILIMFHCIDRKVLSKIFGRLVTNYRKFHKGLPNLFLWNKEISKCKFVVVEAGKDTLQPNQILWMKLLLEVGADVEVCRVSALDPTKNLTEEFTTDGSKGKQ